MKKILFITLALALVGGILAGCSSPDAGAGGATKTDTPAKDASK